MKRGKTAVLLLAAIFAAGLLLSGLKHRFSGSGSDESAPPISLLTYGDAYYEPVRTPRILTFYGLPEEITEKEAGEHLAWLAKDGAGYCVSSEKTDIELLTYAPVPVRAVLVMRERGEYAAMLFSGLIDPPPSPFADLAEIYGMEELVSVGEIDGWLNETNLHITDRNALDSFCRILAESEIHGNETFQKLTFGGIPEEEAGSAYNRFSDNARHLVLEASSGLRFLVTAYPDYDWVHCPGIMSYLKTGDELQDWISGYMD